MNDIDSATGLSSEMSIGILVGAVTALFLLLISLLTFIGNQLIFFLNFTSKGLLETPTPADLIVLYLKLFFKAAPIRPCFIP